MSARVELEARAAGAQANAAAAPPALAPIVLDPDSELGHDLPSDHPPWPRDAISLSGRARALFATLRPVVLRVVAAWEHRVRAIAICGQTLCIDASGSYRVE